MTIMGCGGTGKSVLINTLVACIRKIFNDNNSAFVTAPAGAAAYNVGGSTMHREFKINVRDIPGYNKLSDNTKKELMKKY
jgi:GTPase Era involved in 16S rRNA processing